jgi:hypothetical protein
MLVGISNASIQCRIALGPRAGRRVWRAGEEPCVGRLCRLRSDRARGPSIVTNELRGATKDRRPPLPANDRQPLFPYP